MLVFNMIVVFYYYCSLFFIGGWLMINGIKRLTHQGIVHYSRIWILNLLNSSFGIGFLRLFVEYAIWHCLLPLVVLNKFIRLKLTAINRSFWRWRGITSSLFRWSYHILLMFCICFLALLEINDDLIWVLGWWFTLHYLIVC